MNAKSTSSRQKLMAMAIVAMFAMCAFSVCLAADSDAGPYGGVTDTSKGDRINQTFDVKISVGQTFTYDNITTNLDNVDGTVAITGAPATSGNTATTASSYPTFTDGTTGKKFVISFATAGTYTYIIKAVWTHNTETTLTQTATQTFTFTVSPKIALPTDASGYAIQGGELKALNIPYSGPATGVTVTKAAYSGSILGTTSGTDLFTASISGDKLVVAPTDSVKNTVTTYGLDITVTNDNSKDSDTVHVTFQVFNDIVITAPAPDYTYEGDSGAPSTIEFTTTWDATSGIQSVAYELTKDKDAGALKEVFDVGNGTGRVVTVDKTTISTATIETIVPADSTKIVYTATLKATATVSNGTSSGEGSESSDNIQDSTTKSDTKTTTLTVYKALAFASKPIIGDSAITPITTTGTSINLSSYIKGAYNVTIDWGDGTQTSSMDNNKTETTYGAYHTYAKSGLYTITVSATNDHGTSTSQVLYNADEDAIELPTENPSNDSEEKSFFDVHGYQFLIFLILTILLLVAFFFFGIQNPMVIIIAIVTAALTVLCFVYNDIGGVIDAVKGLFDKA